MGWDRRRGSGRCPVQFRAECGRDKGRSIKGLTWQATWLELEVHRLVVVVWSGGAVRYPYVRNVPSIRGPQ